MRGEAKMRLQEMLRQQKRLQEQAITFEEPVMTVTWARVKEILDKAMERWKAEHGRDPKMEAVHQSPMSWNTKNELLESEPYGLKLIEPEKIGNGKGEETNLVKILKRNIGGYRRMPSRGPFVPEAEIEEIVNWINAGLPDDD
jgi:hypothetical protein